MNTNIYLYSFAVVDFFNRINLIYGTVSEYCNEITCPTMSGGPKYEYLWADGDQFKKPTPLPAPRYIECLMDWTEGQINNEWYVCCMQLIETSRMSADRLCAH